MEAKNDPADGRADAALPGPAESIPSRGRKRDNALDPNIQAHLGRRLKAVYDDVLRQPVPDRFADLLSKLDGEKEGER